MTVGEETGQPLVSCDELIYLKLPNTRCDAWVSGKSFRRTCADPLNPGRGVIPDVTVLPTVDNLKANKDAVLDFTLDLIGRSGFRPNGSK
jgi:hypothetical protein